MKVRRPSFHSNLDSLHHASGGSVPAVSGRLPVRAVRPVVIPEFKRWMVLPLLKESLPTSHTQSKTKAVHHQP